MSSLKKNAAYNIVLSVSQVLFPILVFPYVSRILGPSGMGSIGFVESFTQYFILLAALGIPIYGVREIAKARSDAQHRSQIFSELMVIHLLATLTLLLLFIVLFLSVPALYMHRQLFWIGCGILLLQVFMIEWVFQGMEEFQYITKRSLFIRLCSIGLIFLLVKDAQDVVLYYSISLLTYFANMLANVLYARRFVRIKFRALRLKRHIKPLIYIYAFGIVTSVYTLLDTTILGFFSGVTEVGYYTTSVKLSKLTITVLSALILVTVPVLSHAFHANELEKVKDVLSKSFGYIALIGIPAWIGITLFAGDLIQLFAGPQYLPATASLQLMAPTVVVIGLSNIFGMQILNPSNHERYFFKAAVVGMLISLSVNFALIPSFGQYGAAITTLVTEFVVMLLLYSFARRVIDFAPNWKQFMQALVATLIFIPIRYIVGLLGLDIVFSLLLNVCLCAMAYFGFQYLVFRNALIGDLLFQLAERIKGRGQANN